MLGLLVPPWVRVSSLGAYPDRSTWKAAQTLRKHALPLARAFATGLSALRAALAIGHRTLAGGCRLNKGKKVPSPCQLLLAVTEDNLA